SFSARIRSSPDMSARAHRENFPYSVLLPASGPRSKAPNRLDGACRGFLSRNPLTSAAAGAAIAGLLHRVGSVSGEVQDKKECLPLARSQAYPPSKTAARTADVCHAT